jgi:hypothetical protein
MIDLPYAQELLTIRAELLADAKAASAKVDQFRASVSGFRKLGRGAPRVRVLKQLEALSSPKITTKSLLKNSPDKAADLFARQLAGEFARHATLGACRIVLHALGGGQLRQVPGLWGGLITRGALPDDDYALRSFWKDTVVKVLEQAYPDRLVIDSADPWGAVTKFAACCAVLADLLGAPKNTSEQPEGQEGQWSELMNVDRIAREIDCGDKRSRSVAKKLRTINSELHKVDRQQFRVRLDTMNEPYRSRFTSAR